jgi:hypothetical protein
MCFLPTADQLEYLLKVTQLIGIPVAVVIFFISKRRERLDREYGTYDALDNKYMDYLKLCLDNPDLDVADQPRQCPPLTADQQHREKIVFTMLVSIMERAFLMYQGKSDQIRAAQWSGWDAYIRDWSRRANFAAVFPSLRSQFDTKFVSYTEQLIGSNATAA